MTNRPIDRQGFILLEVLLAAMLITVSLLALSGLFIQATRAHSSMAAGSTAVAIAQAYMEKVKSGLLTAPYDEYTENLNGIVYTVDISEAADTSVDSTGALALVTVTVSWPAGGAVTTVRFVSYIINGLPQFPQ